MRRVLSTLCLGLILLLGVSCGGGSQPTPKPLIQTATLEYLPEDNFPARARFAFNVDPNGSTIPANGPATVRWWVYVHNAGTRPGGQESEVVNLGAHGTLETGISTSRIVGESRTGVDDMLPLQGPFLVELIYTLPNLGGDHLSARVSINYKVGTRSSSVFSDWITFPTGLPPG